MARDAWLSVCFDPMRSFVFGQLQTLTNDRSTAYRPNPAAQVRLRDRQKGQDAYSFDLYFSGFLAVLDTVGADGVAQLAFRPQR